TYLDGDGQFAEAVALISDASEKRRSSHQFPSSPAHFIANMIVVTLIHRGRGMTRRSRGRGSALQLLFQREHNAKMDRAAMEQFVRDRLNEDPLRKFCLLLFDGVVERLSE